MPRICPRAPPPQPTRRNSASTHQGPMRPHGRHRRPDLLSNPGHDTDVDPAKSKYAPWVSLLREDSDYLRTAPAPAYWALAPYYVGQYTETACSLATAVMIVNAGRAGVARGADTKLITQPSLLEAVGSELWRAGVVSDDGHGVGLVQLQNL